jgi:hypothetical protein
LPAKDTFQERLIIVEMESGVRFNLLQDNQIFDPATKLGTVCKHSGNERDLSQFLNKEVTKT